MKSEAEKEVAVVFVITGYTDGSITFMQDVPRKDFWTIKRCMHSARQFFTTALKNGPEKCPFSPRNVGDVRLTSGALTGEVVHNSDDDGREHATGVSDL